MGLTEPAVVDVCVSVYMVAFLLKGRTGGFGANILSVGAVVVPPLVVVLEPLSRGTIESVEGQLEMAADLREVKFSIEILESSRREYLIFGYVPRQETGMIGGR